jgi:hypothetical protein
LAAKLLECRVGNICGRAVERGYRRHMGPPVAR